MPGIWIETANRLPPLDVSVLCCCRIYGRFVGMYARIADTEWGQWSNQKDVGILPPTHWMPLPDKPDTDDYNK